MSWYKDVIEKLENSKIFSDVEIVGAKVRGVIEEDLYLDIYYDLNSGSYSYALINRELPFPGDKRVFGWDDYPHENVEKKRISQLSSSLSEKAKKSEGLVLEKFPNPKFQILEQTLDFGRFFPSPQPLVPNT